MMTLFFLSASGGQGGDPLPTFIFMGAIFLVMYFFMIRPQSNKAKEQKKLIDNLQKGDRIVTIGGLHGRVLRVNDDSLLVEIDTNTKVKLEKSVVSLEFTKALQSKSPAKEESDNKGASS